MNWPDLTNATFELWGGIAIWSNCYALWRDKVVRGVSISTTGFFFFWGMWNLFFYPYLDQWASLFGAAVIASGNLAWVLMAVHFRRQEDGCR